MQIRARQEEGLFVSPEVLTLVNNFSQAHVVMLYDIKHHRFVEVVCNFPGFLSPQPKFETMDRPVLKLCFTAQFYLSSKGEYILKP